MDQKITRVEAFNQVVKALENNQIDRANNMLALICDSISKDKPNDTPSSYITLKKKKHAQLFSDISDKNI